MKIFSCLFLLAMIVAAPATHAQCVNPPAEMGVLIMNKKHKVMQYCNGDVWVGLWGGGGGSGSSHWMKSGNTLYYNDGNIGIGTSNPQTRLHVSASSDTVGDGLRLSSWSALRVPATGSGALLFDYYTGSEWREAMRISTAGRVGIGTTSPKVILHVEGAGHVYPRIQSTDSHAGLDIYSASGNAAHVRYYGGGAYKGTTGWDHANDAMKLVYSTGIESANGISVKSSGNVGIGTLSPSYKLHVNGSVAGTGAYNALSDARHKKNVEPMAYGLSDVLALNPVTYEWMDQGEAWRKGRKVGLIAQETEAIIPEVVSTADDKQGMKSIAYGELVPVLVKAVQELAGEVETLKRARE